MHSICSLVCRNKHSGAGALVCCGASQLAVCSRKLESRPGKPLGQHPGSSVDVCASMERGRTQPWRGASQLAVCSRKPASKPRRPLGQGLGSNVDVGANIRLGVHSHCTRVRYTDGRVHSHRTHVRYTHPKSVLKVISMCISGLCPMAVYLDVYIGPVFDARVPPRGCTQGS